MRIPWFSMAIFCFLFGCKPRQDHRPQSFASVPPPLPVTTIASVKTVGMMTENFLNILRYAASVESEIIKLLDPRLKNSNRQLSQLQIVSLLLDQKSGLKTLPINFDCQIISVVENGRRLTLTKKCQVPYRVMATIDEKVIGRQLAYQVSFVQSEWKSIIGDSALLNQKDKVCELKVNEEKLSRLTCNDHLATLGSGTQLEEIRISEFTFRREGSPQIVVQGGRYKDFTERSKIQITVPETGRITFEEKNLKVKDEFLNERGEVDPKFLRSAPEGPTVYEPDINKKVGDEARDAADTQSGESGLNQKMNRGRSR